jgi:uncharacterized Zn finger protein (UPF0148 family)
MLWSSENDLLIGYCIVFRGKDMIICPKCRAKLGDGSSVCVVCGTSLTGGSAPPAKAPEPAPAAAAPAIAPAQPSVEPTIAAQPLPDRPLPRSELIDERKVQAPPEQQTAPPQGQQPPGRPAGQQAQNLPPQQPPPPDHPIYQQQYQQQYQQGYYQQSQGSMMTHPYQQGMPNQCPRCQHMNVVYFYNNGTAYCGSCYYRYYWKAPSDGLDDLGRQAENIFM